MATEFAGYVSKDGKPFNTQIEAVTHEVKLDLEKSFPEMRPIVNQSNRFDEMLTLLLPLTELIHSSPHPSAIPPDNGEIPPGVMSKWPDEVEDAMSEDNLGEMIEHTSIDGRKLDPVYSYQAPPGVERVWFGTHEAAQDDTGAWIMPREAIIDAQADGKPLPAPHEHDWQPTDNPLIDRCSVCDEERA